METLMEVLMAGILPLMALVVLLLPPVLTVLNLYNLFSKKNVCKDIADIATLVAGISFTWFLYKVLWNPIDWMYPLYDGSRELINLHAPVASWLEKNLLAAGAVALLGYCLLRFLPDKLPPLISVFCLAACYLGCGLGGVWCVQLFSNLWTEALVWYLCLLPLNFIFLTISLVKGMVADLSQREEEFPGLENCARLLESSKGWPALAFVLLWGLLGVLVMILTLFGQPPDALVKAFTQTSDWTFSQQVSPPPIPYDSHYLCTVAAQGHPKLVRPLRMGKRHGRSIVVNRQLCVANAFEDYLAEKLPPLHRWIRGIYDRYGYPLSQHIRTPLAADIVYLLMKPLEWAFLLFL